jgi:hypothetical protein
MNFGLALAAGRIPGVQFNLSSLNENKEPESAEAALITYSKLLMPERDATPTIKRLAPLLKDPNNDKKIDAASSATSKMAVNNEEDLMDEPEMEGDTVGKEKYRAMQMQTKEGNNSMLAQVVGIIIGSPEFQRK